MPLRVLQGLVVSHKANKTVIVSVERSFVHPLYKKHIKRHRRYAAHDPLNSFKVGDSVSIVESAPISKTKKWVVKNLVDSSFPVVAADRNAGFLGFNKRLVGVLQIILELKKFSA